MSHQARLVIIVAEMGWTDKTEKSPIIGREACLQAKGKPLETFILYDEVSSPGGR